MALACRQPEDPEPQATFRKISATTPKNYTQNKSSWKIYNKKEYDYGHHFRNKQLLSQLVRQISKLCSIKEKEKFFYKQWNWKNS